MRQRGWAQAWSGVTPAICSREVRRNGPPDAVSRMRRTPLRRLPRLQRRRHALEDRVVLAVDRHQHRTALARGIDEQRARHHQRFLVGDQDVLAGARRRQRRRQPGSPDDGRHHDVHLGTGGYGVQRVEAADDLRGALRGTQFERRASRAASASCSTATRRSESQALLEQRRPARRRGQRGDRVTIRVTGQHVERADTDAAGAAEDRDALHGTSPSASRPSRNVGAAAVRLSMRSRMPP